MNVQNSSVVNFKRAFANLERSLAHPITEPRDQSGIIKDFEMTYELSWKALKKKLIEQGHQTLGAKDVYTKSYQLGFLSNEKVWLAMIEDRNLTSHVYDETSAMQIISRIKDLYLPAFRELLQKQFAASAV
jgi:nucleotidyltransferase substrate binding protein (TIGR01987 family)